jgi:hypothetical protein
MKTLVWYSFKYDKGYWFSVHMQHIDTAFVTVRDEESKEQIQSCKTVNENFRFLYIYITVVLHDTLTFNMLVINIHMYISQHVSAIVSHHQV